MIIITEINNYYSNRSYFFQGKGKKKVKEKKRKENETKKYGNKFSILMACVRKTCKQQEI